MDARATKGWNERYPLCLGSLKTEIVAQRKGHSILTLFLRHFPWHLLLVATWDTGMTGLLVGCELTFFYVFMMALMTRPKCRDRDTPCPWWVTGLRAVGRTNGAEQQGWGRQRQPSGRKSSMYLFKKVHRPTRNKTQALPWQTEIPTRACCSPRQAEGLSLAQRQRWPSGFSSPFFPVGKSPASAQVVSKPHTMRHPQG